MTKTYNTCWKLKGYYFQKEIFCRIVTHLILLCRYTLCFKLSTLFHVYIVTLPAYFWTLNIFPAIYVPNVLPTSRLQLGNWSFYNSLYCNVYKTQSKGLYLSKFKGGHLKYHSENSHLQFSEMWLSRTHGDVDRHDSFNHLIVKLPCYTRLFAT